MQPDRLCFYSKSRDALPGAGAGEHVEDASAYTALATFRDWRKTLSNFDVAPFVFRGKRYNSIEHAFQGTKIALCDPESAEYFTLDSGHEIGQGDGAIAQKHRKLVILSKEHIAQWNAISDSVMAEAAAAKYAEPGNSRARAILAATGRAELLHIMRGKKVRFDHLELIRKGLV
jgi:predicted NAD-dependent protein-ADP-ribosyltransferase YbiA (DUF1768 family)